MNATIQPIRQPIADAIRNAAQVASNWAQVSEGDAAKAFERIAQFLRGALDQLGEPNAACLARTEHALEYHQSIIRHDGEDWAHYIRDTASVILQSQLRGTL